MRFRLRTLLIVLAVGPPLLAPLGVWGWRQYVAWRSRQSYAQISKAGYLGALLDDNLGPGRGVSVKSVRPGSPAEAGGLMDGDVITSINHRPCPSLDAFDAELCRFAAGSTLRMVVSRDGQSKALAVKLGPRPAPP